MSKLRSYAAPLIMVLMLLLFVGGLLWGYKAMTSPIGVPPTPEPTCVPQTADDVTPDMVTVSVYNVDTKQGHAKQVAEMLAEVGFVLDTVSNASHPVLGQAVIVGSAVDAPEVLLVAGFFLDVAIEADGRADHSVDIYIANALDVLNPDAPTSVDVQGDSVCLPSITPKPSETPTPGEGESTEPEGQA
jgi:hypothetical protein